MATHKSKAQSANEIMERNFPYGFETADVEITKSPYHKSGQRVTMGKSVAEKMESKGWGKIIAMLALFIMAGICQSHAQEGVELYFRNTTYAAVSPPILLDSSVNAGTSSITTGRVGGSGTSTTIVLTATEISGTGAGTLTLLGSIDGTNFEVIPTPNTVTATPTQTLTDTSGAKRYTWILSGSPCLYYRITHSGGTTMVYTFGARLMKH